MRTAPIGGAVAERKSSRHGRQPSVGTPVCSAQARELLRKLEAARQRLDRRTAALGIITAWRNELRVRLARAELQLELTGLPDEEQDALVAEVAEFKRLCRILGWFGRRQS